MTSWRTYKAPCRPMSSSVDPNENAPQNFQTRKHSNTQPKTNSLDEMTVEDLDKEKNRQLNGFVNKWKEKALHSEGSEPGYRRKSMV